MSDAQLMAYFQQVELEKQRRRFEKIHMRGNETAKSHKFWNTQPVVGMTEVVKDENGPIEGPRDDVRQASDSSNSENDQLQLQLQLQLQ